MPDNYALPEIIGKVDLKTIGDQLDGCNKPVVAVAMPDNDKFSDYVHDLRGCARTFKLIVQMLEDGDRFDNEDGKKILQQASQSTQSLKAALEFFKSLASIDR